MRLILRVLYSVLLFGAGILYFVHEQNFRKIIQQSLPFRRTIVLVSGVFEMIFATLLWIKKGQHITSKLLAFFYDCCFSSKCVYVCIEKTRTTAYVTL